MRLIPIILLSFVYSTVTDIDGNVYETVQIGDQLWMKENLKVTHYNNGDEIPNITVNDDWISTSDGAFDIYGNFSTYGLLYNWYVADDNRGVCPDNFRIPSDSDFIELEIYLGMNIIQTDMFGTRGTNEGSKISGNTELWIFNSALENNSDFGSSEFDAFPSGLRAYHDGDNSGLGTSTYFWTSTDYNGNSSIIRRLFSDSAGIDRGANEKHNGYSIRCLADETSSGNIYIPQDYPTIQEGINASADGDTVMVAAGTYYENINFNKNITLIGEDRETTIIDGGGNGSVIISSTGSYEFFISNMTVVNGINDYGGGLKINTNQIVHLDNIIILNNQASVFGGAIHINNNSHLYIYDSLIEGNSASSSGGAIAGDGNAFCTMDKVTVTNNTSNQYGAFKLTGQTSITNSIVYDNPGWMDAGFEYEFDVDDCPNYNISYSIPMGPCGSFEFINPQFSDPDNGDYTLQPTSPCIDAGDPNSPLDPDGTRADMGAYYYHQEVSGCTDPNFENYEPDANVDDGSCGTYDFKIHIYNNSNNGITLSRLGFNFNTAGYYSKITSPQLDEDIISSDDYKITIYNSEEQAIAPFQDIDLYLYGDVYDVIFLNPGDTLFRDSNDNNFSYDNIYETGLEGKILVGLIGDLNGDSYLDIQDIIIFIDLIINIFEHGSEPTEKELIIGDIYEDGELNVIDIVGLVNIILEQ